MYFILWVCAVNQKISIIDALVGIKKNEKILYLVPHRATIFHSIIDNSLLKTNKTENKFK